MISLLLFFLNGFFFARMCCFRPHFCMVYFHWSYHSSYLKDL